MKKLLTILVVCVLLFSTICSQVEEPTEEEEVVIEYYYPEEEQEAATTLSSCPPTPNYAPNSQLRVNGWPNFRGSLGCSGNTLVGTILRTLNNGEIVTYLSAHPTCVCGYRFLRVRTSRGEVGYVASTFIVLHSSPSPAPPPPSGAISGNVYGNIKFINKLTNK